MMTMVISGSDGVTFPDSTNQFSGGAFSFKNRVINGDMRIDQRNAGAEVSPAPNGYSIDRWATYKSGAGTWKIQQSTTAPTGFNNSALLTVTSNSTPSGNDYYILLHAIEGFNVADLGWGSASAKTITLSFWTRSSVTGTFAGALRNSAENRSYPFTYTISSADTWEQKSITIAGDTSGTWLTNNGRGITLTFCLGGAGTTLGTAGAWNSNNNAGASGQTNWIATSGATFYITGVQLEVGSVATPFERRPYGTELALCQRYACSSFPLGTAWGQNAGTAGAFSYIVLVGGTSAGFGISMPFPVTMRANPTLTYYNPSAANDKWRNTIANADSASGAGVNIRAWGTQITNYQVAGDVASQTCQVHWSVTAEL